MYKKIYVALLSLLVLGTACAASPTTLAQAPTFSTQPPARPQSAACKIPVGAHPNQAWANGSQLSLETTLAMSSQALPSGPHIQLAQKQTHTAEDEQRSNTLLQNIRNNLSQYLDYCKALQDGYLPVVPTIKQDVYHFASSYVPKSDSKVLDTIHPAALLYVQVDGIYQLIGAMYMAPAQLSEEQLDTLFPVGIIPWFKHVNYCLPQNGQQATPSIKAITTASACGRVGGTFTAQPYGWMIQIYAFGE